MEAVIKALLNDPTNDKLMNLLFMLKVQDTYISKCSKEDLYALIEPTVVADTEEDDEESVEAVEDDEAEESRKYAKHQKIKKAGCLTPKESK